MGPEPSASQATAVTVRLAVRIVAVVALLAGGVFFFQGLGVIPGSFMTGRNEWAVIGAGLVAGAAALLWLVELSKRPRSGR